MSPHPHSSDGPWPADDLWSGVSPASSRQLLLAALDCFATRGYDATTTREIAQMAGVSPAAIYVYYEAKHDLLFEISRISHVASLEAVEKTINGYDSATDRFWHFMRTFVSWNARNHRVARINQYELGSLPPKLFERIRELRTKFESLLHQELERGIRSGEFNITNLAVTEMVLLSMGIDVSRWYHGRLTSPDHMGESYADIALRIVGADDSTDTGPDHRPRRAAR